MTELNLFKGNSQTMSSREIASLTSKDHSHIMRDIRRMFEQLGVEQNPYLDFDNSGANGRKVEYFELPKRECLILSSGYNVQLRAAIIDRWIELETKEAKEIKLPDFSNPAIAARAWAEQFEQKSIAQARIKQMEPKVLFANAVETSKTSILIGELAKILKQNGVNIGQNRLFEWMRNNGYLISRKGTDYNMPTQKSMNLELFEIKETTINHPDGHVSVNKTSKVKGKGQTYFINKFLTI